MKTLFFILTTTFLFSCAKQRIAGEYEEELKLSPNFEATTTPIHVLSNNLDVNECFYQNNFVKLIAFDPSIVDYSWYKCHTDAGDEFVSHDSVFVTSLDGDYRLDVEFDIPGVGEIDSSVFISLNHCNTGVDIPSSFVPDADGQFDTWFPIFSGVSNFYVRISDDNGNVIFESTTESNVFDGTYNNSKLPSDSYLYYISGTYRTGYIFEQQGVLELVR